MARLFNNFGGSRPKDPKKIMINDPVVSKTSSQSFVDLIDTGEITDFSEFYKFRSLSNDRESLYLAYDAMLKDAIISSAVDMYAEDATQYDSSGRYLWVESDDSNVADACNLILKEYRIDSLIYSITKCLVTYGDAYLELYRVGEPDVEYMDYSPRSVDRLMTSKGPDGSPLHKLEVPNSARYSESVELVANPASIFDLVDKGVTVGFVKNDKPSDNSSKVRSELLMYDPGKFIHFCLEDICDRDPETISVRITQKDDNEHQLAYKTYRVKSGKSIFKDSYKAYREVSLIEDALLLNRVSRSSILRLINVEVGDMPKPEIRKLLDRIKSKMEQKLQINVGEGKFRPYNNPGPVDNMIFSPTKNGKGVITASNVGGDVDIKSIADLDHFQSKVFSNIKIPKRFLGMSEDEGLNGGQSLAKQDTRYARSVKRVQTSDIKGITDLLNLILSDRGLESYINQFTVRMVSPSSIEDNEREDLMTSRIANAQSILSMINDSGADLTPESKQLVLEYLLKDTLSLPDISDLIHDNLTEDKEEIDINDDDIETIDLSDSDNESEDGYVDDSINSEDDSLEVPDYSMPEFPSES